MKELILVAVLAAPALAWADDWKCDYASHGGTELRFDDPRSDAASVALDFSPHKDFSAPIAVDALRGKLAKVVGPTTGDVRTNLQLVMEDCTTVFMRDDDGHLLTTDLDRVRLSVLSYSADRPTPWHVQRKIDPVDDTKSCTVQTHGKMPSPFFVWTQRGGFSVGTLGADFPNRPVALRVDSNAAIEGGEQIRGENAQRLLRQIRAGAKAILAAGYVWPDDFRVSASHATDGLIDRIDECISYMR